MSFFWRVRDNSKSWSCCIGWNYLDRHFLYTHWYNSASSNKAEALVGFYFSTIMSLYFRCLVQSRGVFLRSVIVRNFDTLGISPLRFGSTANEALAAYQSFFAVFREWLFLFRLTASSVLFSLYCNLWIHTMFLTAFEGWSRCSGIPDKSVKGYWLINL